MAEQNTEELEKQKELTEQNAEATKELVKEVKKLTEVYKKNNKTLTEEKTISSNIKAIEEDELEIAEKIGDTEEKTNKIYTKRTGILDGLKKSLMDMQKAASEAFRITGLEGFRIKDVVTQTIKINSELTKMSATLGEVNGNGFTQVKQAFVTATKEIGESFEEAKETVHALINEGYVGNFSEAARAISLFSKATDVSRSNVASTYDFLNKTMKMSEDSIASIYATMQKVSQTYGLTKKGMETVSSSIKVMTTNMKAFGSNEANIKQMAVGTAKLASQFEKVGLAASDAAAMVDRLTNPDNIENNIGLYAQLGMSITDALTGNFDEAQMRTGLADFGNRLKEMGPIAGSAFAKTFNISYKDAMKYADMEQITENAVTPEVKAMEELTKGLEKTQDGFAAMQTAINKIKGALSSLSPVLLGVLALVVPKVTKFIKDTFDELKNGAKGVESSGGRKKSGSLNMSNIAKEYNKNYSNSGITAVEHNIDFSDKSYKDIKAKLTVDMKELQLRKRSEIKTINKSIQQYNRSNELQAKTLIKAEAYQKAMKEAEEALLKQKTSITQKTAEQAVAAGQRRAKLDATAGSNIFKRGAARVGYVGSTAKAVVTGGMSTMGGPLGGISKIFGGIGKVAGGFMKALGPIGIALSILLPILQKNQKFMNMINKITTKVTNILEEALMPVIDILVEAFMPLVETLFTIISPLLKIIAPILKLLLQPVIWVVKLLNWILWPLKKLAEFLGGESLDDNTEAVKENTEAQSNNAPEQIMATADGRVVATKVTIENSATETAKATTNNLHQQEKETERQNKADNMVYSVGTNLISTINLMAEQFKEFVNFQKNMFAQPDIKDNLTKIIEDGTSGIKLRTVQISENKKESFENPPSMAE